MHYNGKYSLKTYLLTESGEINKAFLNESWWNPLDWFEDWLAVEPETLPDDDECIGSYSQYDRQYDDFYGLPIEAHPEDDCISFIEKTDDDEKRRTMKRLKDMDEESDQKLPDKEFRKIQRQKMTPYVARWDEFGPEIAEKLSTKKVKTYRDLKLVLTSMTITEEELEKAKKKMVKLGWTGVFAMAGFKLCKFALSKVTGLQDFIAVAGLAKDIGETAIEAMAQKALTIPPKKAKSNPLSDALTLHQDYSTIIDPELEQDMFRELLMDLSEVEEQGGLDREISTDELSFTDYAEGYIETEVGDPNTKLTGADKAGDTRKLTDITIPKFTSEQEELFYDWMNMAGQILMTSHEAI